ncbi:MAG: cation:proton antiporter, partial [Cytophagales bacterium]|nr:cation:proton antiporter [Cytophagales bacterium]
MTLVIAICLLLLIAYVFDLTAPKTRIPSVILLLLLGWAVRRVANAFETHLPDFTPALPVLGTIGLILIVLEGSLELELNRSKFGLVGRSFLMAFVPLLVASFALAYAFAYFGGYSFKDCLTNAIPLCVISSAIAIPSARHLAATDREFVTYESSLSDILGVVFFNFMALHQRIDWQAFKHFGTEMLLVTAISFAATLGLAFLLGRIDHHIKFGPIIILTILIYAVSKMFHLPALIFILAYGLFLGNLEEMRRVPWIQRLRPTQLAKEVERFKEVTGEATFLIRSLFFLLFGYLLETSEILNPDTLLWAANVVCLVFLVRAVTLRLMGYPLLPLLFIAPRGLITILLFLGIPAAQSIDLVNRSLV